MLCVFGSKLLIFGMLECAFPLLQIEKVLQQGEISDCADPYMTLKESESKVVCYRHVLNLNFKDKCRYSHIFFKLIKSNLEFVFFRTKTKLKNSETRRKLSARDWVDTGCLLLGQQ